VTALEPDYVPSPNSMRLHAAPVKTLDIENAARSAKVVEKTALLHDLLATISTRLPSGSRSRAVRISLPAP
jgi:hypothetical protein